MKLVSLTALVSVIGMSPVFSQTTTEGRDLANYAFETIDVSENGMIDMGESHIYGEGVFSGMDADDNARVSETEFLAWGTVSKTLRLISTKSLLTEPRFGWCLVFGTATKTEKFRAQNSVLPQIVIFAAQMSTVMR